MTLTLPNDIINGTDADAAQVEQNYNAIQDYINSSVINRDGSVAMQAPLLLAGPPTQPLHAATKAYVDAILPIGIMMPYGGITVPGGGQWALCNGAALSQTSYPDLFNVIGSRFGTAPAGSFLLPNTAGRMLVGVDASDTTCDTVGETGGTTVPPLKTHTHANDHNHGSVASGGQSANHVHSAAHDHGGFNVTTPDHRHLGRWLQIWAATAGSKQIGVFVVSTTTPVVGPADLLSGQTPDGGATLAINVPSWSGNTGPNSVSHTHTTDLPNYVGVTGAPKEAVDTKYRPPFVAMTYIIRVK